MPAGHLRSALAPKLDSAVALGATLGLHPVRATLAFSSVASLFGAAGQGNYAAANGALEAWAQGQAGSGLTTTAVQWGAWAAGERPAECRDLQSMLKTAAPQDQLFLLGGCMGLDRSPACRASPRDALESSSACQRTDGLCLVQAWQLMRPLCRASSGQAWAR